MGDSAPPRSGTDSVLRDFLRSEAAGGVLLMLAAALAMIVANSPLYDAYHHFLHEIDGPTLTRKLGPMTPHLWINDGLMAIFFLLVGLEIKREFIDGRLSTWERRRLPFIAAAAGMLVPALIYLFITRNNPELENGWAIPAATDIAFAIGVLALLGKRAPASLKLFLVTVAIVDDMGAVAIIAIAYTETLATIWLFMSAIVLGVMYVFNKSGVRSIPIYLIMAVVLWYCVLMSGVHATIAGVLAALTIPLDRTPGAPDAKDSPLHILEHAIHPWSAYLIIPVFGFANAGVSLEGMGTEQILAPLPLGIAAGLFLGKQLGIFGSVWIAVKTGYADKMGGASWTQIYGVSLLCGIGFTMSLFIGALAFPGNALLIDEAKIGVLLGSVLSAIVGFLLIRFAPNADKELETETGKTNTAEAAE
ncbi:Na+/H+ antiporter NhaA [Sphingorhabdus sp. Alg239-R122]|uniref:Na+/H+ antiporter NhaA n=1 Tax=Sphingorhabdus sp. Alg239-R122 TaxID=2305989 RepID=UPI0013DAD9A8|nr:Na+/H+ antiporter NhaA [Sphingorhabdus sp. Alg239-R122]